VPQFDGDPQMPGELVERSGQPRRIGVETLGQLQQEGPSFENRAA